MSAGPDAADGEPDLQQRVAELEREVEILQSRLDAFADAFDRLEDAVTGDVPPGDVEGDLLARLGTLESRLVDLEARAAPDPDTLDYENMSRADKAEVIRRALIDEAERNGGKAGFTYKEVRQRLDGRPSPGHAYSIMETAAEADGFQYGAFGQRDQKRVGMDDLQAAKGSTHDSRPE